MYSTIFTVKNRIAYRGRCVLTAQRMVRGFLARRRHRPRLQGILKITSIRNNLAQTKDIAGQLKTNKDGILKQVADMEQLIAQSIARIKGDGRIDAAAIDALCSDITSKMNQQNNWLKTQLQVRGRRQKTGAHIFKLII